MVGSERPGDRPEVHFVPKALDLQLPSLHQSSADAKSARTNYAACTYKVLSWS